jgi:hypothetical protein
MFSVINQYLGDKHFFGLPSLIDILKNSFHPTPSTCLDVHVARDVQDWKSFTSGNGIHQFHDLMANTYFRFFKDDVGNVKMTSRQWVWSEELPAGGETIIRAGSESDIPRPTTIGVVKKRSFTKAVKNPQTGVITGHAVDRTHEKTHKWLVDNNKIAAGSRDYEFWEELLKEQKNLALPPTEQTELGPSVIPVRLPNRELEVSSAVNGGEGEGGLEEGTYDDDSIVMEEAVAALISGGNSNPAYFGSVRRRVAVRAACDVKVDELLCIKAHHQDLDEEVDGVKVYRQM